MTRQGSSRLPIHRHTGITSSRWVVWATNPTSIGMVGSQALVAYQQTDGSMRVYTSPITQYQTQLRESGLSFDVWDLSATYENNEIIIFANLGLPNDGTTLNQVWLEGALSGNTPQMHATSGANVRSIYGDLESSFWYLKVFKSADPAWFYLHDSCQFSTYVVGMAGWGTGLKLGTESPGIQFDAHRTIGIILVSLQVFALLLKAKARTQIQIILKYLLPFGGIHSRNP
ncbi:hypothetical protein DITRI_Ditri02bG0002000 [Diplodiscus trichospermus]